jgi:hypothetical protein
MQLFEGVQDSTGINWKNPVPIDQPKPKDQEIPQDNKGGGRAFFFEGGSNVGIIMQDDRTNKDLPDGVYDKVAQIAWGGEGLELEKDSVIKIDGYAVRLMKMDTNMRARWPGFSSTSTTPTKGTNTFTEDTKTNYIFSIKKLGWANIDRLYSDPRTKEVEFVTSIENQSEFENVYVSLIVSNQKMHIPGYQKKDNTFSFTHGDYEKPSLPVGETATILATAYKNDKPYFAIQKIKIKDKQNISFQLTETTMEKLKTELKEKI